MDHIAKTQTKLPTEAIQKGKESGSDKQHCSKGKRQRSQCRIRQFWAAYIFFSKKSRRKCAGPSDADREQDPRNCWLLSLGLFVLGLQGWKNMGYSLVN
jgi:hypothetical protein